jgi:hypothetical protein
VGFEPGIKITSLSVPRSTQSPGKCPHFDRHFDVIHRSVRFDDFLLRRLVWISSSLKPTAIHPSVEAQQQFRFRVSYRYVAVRVIRVLKRNHLTPRRFQELSQAVS